MKLLVVGILLTSVVLFGCVSVDSYIFKQDRVDQEMAGGNRGYATDPPPVDPEATKGVPQRTMFGFDIEVPLMPGDEGYKPSSKRRLVLHPDLRRINKEK